MFIIVIHDIPEKKNLQFPSNKGLPANKKAQESDINR